MRLLCPPTLLSAYPSLQTGHHPLQGVEQDRSDQQQQRRRYWPLRGLRLAALVAPGAAGSIRMQPRGGNDDGQACGR